MHKVRELLRNTQREGMGPVLHEGCVGGTTSGGKPLGAIRLTASSVGWWRGPEIRMALLPERRGVEGGFNKTPAAMLAEESCPCASGGDAACSYRSRCKVTTDLSD